MPPSFDSSEEPGRAVGACRLEVTAVLEKTTHVAALGWRLWVDGTPQPARARPRRYGRTRIAAEIAALGLGLREVGPAGCAELLVAVADPRLVGLLTGTPDVRLRRAGAAAARLGRDLARFRSVRYESEFAPDPELAHAMGEALDTALHRVAEREELRDRAMERIVERAREVVLERDDRGWLANGRYRVALDPPSCECPAWTTRWSRTPIAARRAQRLPCKHLVALALHEGIRVPADLAALARRAPP